MRKLLFILMFCLICSSVFAKNYCTEEVSVVACWYLEEGSGTSTDNAEGTAGLDGTFKGTGEPAWDTELPDSGDGFSGTTTYSALFDASDDYIDCGNSDILTEDGALTITAWIFPETDHAGSILSRRGAGGGTVDLRVMNDVSKSLRFRVYSGVTPLLRQSVANSITTGAWNHVAVTWDGSTTATNVHLYVNGSEVTYQTTTNGSSLADNSDGYTRIGNINPTFVYFDGNIDEVGYFNAVLSESDITAIMQYGLDGSGTPSGARRMIITQ